MQVPKETITAEKIVEKTFTFLNLPDPDKIFPKSKQILYKKNYKAHQKELKEMIKDYKKLHKPVLSN